MTQIGNNVTEQRQQQQANKQNIQFTKQNKKHFIIICHLLRRFFTYTPRHTHTHTQSKGIIRKHLK